MTGHDGIVMVISDTPDEAQNIKELIEFMDMPLVCTSVPANWLSLVGERILDAVFLGPDLPDKSFRSVVDQVGEYSPNVPIVVLHKVTES